MHTTWYQSYVGMFDFSWKEICDGVFDKLIFFCDVVNYLSFFPPALHRIPVNLLIWFGEGVGHGCHPDAGWTTTSHITASHSTSLTPRQRCTYLGIAHIFRIVLFGPVAQHLELELELELEWCSNVPEALAWCMGGEKKKKKKTRTLRNSALLIKDDSDSAHKLACFADHSLNQYASIRHQLSMHIFLWPFFWAFYFFCIVLHLLNISTTISATIP